MRDIKNIVIFNVEEKMEGPWLQGLSVFVEISAK
jgi:hypothetical protein